MVDVFHFAKVIHFFLLTKFLDKKNAGNFSYSFCVLQYAKFRNKTNKKSRLQKKTISGIVFYIYRLRFDENLS